MQKAARAVVVEIIHHAGEHVGVVHGDQRADGLAARLDRRGVEQAALVLGQHHAAIVDAGDHRLPRLRALDRGLRVAGELVGRQADITAVVPRDDDAGAFEGEPCHALKIALLKRLRELRGDVLRVHVFPRLDEAGERIQHLRVGAQHAADGVAVFLDAELHFIQRRRGGHAAQFVLQKRPPRHKDDADGDRQRREAIDALPELFFFPQLTLSASAYPPPRKFAPDRSWRQTAPFLR